MTSTISSAPFTPARLPIGEIVVTAVTVLDADERDIADLYDAVGELATRCGGRFAGANGSTALALYPCDEAAAAVNATISLMEGTPGRLAAGIAFGEITWAGQPRSIVPTGPVATACRLAELANSGSILLDLDLVAVTPLHRISSHAGAESGRRLTDYLSEPQALPAADRSELIGFVELLWDRGSHGVRPRAVTELAWWRAPERPDKPAAPSEATWERGRLWSWNRERQRGVIAAEDGRRFYVDDRFLAIAEPPALGDPVWFVPRPALIAGRNPVAAVVVAAGHVLTSVACDLDARVARVSDPAGVIATIPVHGPVAASPYELVLDAEHFAVITRSTTSPQPSRQETTRI